MMKRILTVIALTVGLTACGPDTTPPDNECYNHGGIAKVAENLYHEREHHSKGGYYTYEEVLLDINCKNTHSYYFQEAYYEVQDDESLPSDSHWKFVRTLSAAP